MNCFQLIKTVLDEAYSEIDNTVDDRDQRIRNALETMSESYGNLLKQKGPSYSDPVYRFAYIYRYTTSHANLVYLKIKQSEKLNELFDRSELNVSCIGGGPGSDFLGILKYCLKSGRKPRLRCMLTDKDPAWAESWSDVDDKVKSELNLSTIFYPFDVTEETSWQSFKKHYNADLFTMIYFFSELYARKDDASQYFNSLFTKMKSGSRVLYIDNNDENFHSWIDQLAKTSNCKILESDAGELKLPIEEEKNDLSPYLEKFSSPKLTAKVGWRILEKN